MAENTSFHTIVSQYLIPRQTAGIERNSDQSGIYLPLRTTALQAKRNPPLTLPRCAEEAEWIVVSAIGCGLLAGRLTLSEE
jgi:hypothetical protein